MAWRLSRNTELSPTRPNHERRKGQRGPPKQSEVSPRGAQKSSKDSILTQYTSKTPLGRNGDLWPGRAGQTSPDRRKISPGRRKIMALGK